MKSETEARLISFAASTFIRVLHSTLRVRHVRTEPIDRLNREGKHYIVAFWHGHLLLMVYAKYSRPIHVMISQSRDGEIISQTMARFGVESVRGSSSRGATAALRHAARIGREANLAFTPDGPRGPRHVAQGGVVAAAQLAGIPIVPVVIVAKKKRGCAPGTASRSRGRSRGCCSSTVSRSRFRAMHPRSPSAGGSKSRIA